MMNEARRLELIDLLEQDDVERILNHPDGVETLRVILTEGFIGYYNFTQAELEALYQERQALKEYL